VEIFEEPIVYGPCTRACLLTFNDTLVNHCEGLDPKDEFQCVLKAFVTMATCIDNCVAPNGTMDESCKMGYPSVSPKFRKLKK